LIEPAIFFDSHQKILSAPEPKKKTCNNLKRERKTAQHFSKKQAIEF
jgi:hypothetical protein